MCRREASAGPAGAEPADVRSADRRQADFYGGWPPARINLVAPEMKEKKKKGEI